MPLPLASVLLPAYNAAQHLRAAIDSILEQTFTDFELLLINDGSTDATEDIILSYRDKRIRYIKNEKNLSLIPTFNRGIKAAKGKYIVRMDADDISLPKRIEKQIEFMEAHPEIGLLGSYIMDFNDKNNAERLVKYQTEHEAIKFQLLFHTHFPHPAAVLRTSVLDNNKLFFEKKYEYAEDYGLWNKMVEYCKLAIIPEVLVKKRSHEKQYTEQNLPRGAKATAKIRLELLERIGVKPAKEVFQHYENLLKGNIPKTEKEIFALLDLLKIMILENRTSNQYEITLFEFFFAERFWLICTQSTHLGKKIVEKFEQASIFLHYPISLQQRVIFYGKAMIRYRYSNSHVHSVLEA